MSISARELEMSEELIRSFESDFEPERFSDTYQDELRGLIEAKLESGKAIDTETTLGEGRTDEGGGEVLDLMEALRRSIDASRAANGQGKKDARRTSRKAKPTGTAASG